MELGILLPEPVNPKNTLLAQSQTKKVSSVSPVPFPYSSFLFNNLLWFNSNANVNALSVLLKKIKKI